MRIRLTLSAALTTTVAAMLLSPTAVLAAAAEEKCLKKELESAGLVAKRVIACHADAAAAGDAVANKCLKSARKKYNQGVDAATAGDKCLPALDDRGSRRDAERLADQLSVALVTTPNDKDKCAAKKLKAAGKRAKALLDVHADFVKREQRDDFVAEFAKVEPKLAKKFSKLENKLSCGTTEDAEFVAQLVNGYADFAMGSFRLVDQETSQLASGAEPAETPGSPGVDATDYPALQTQFGTTDVDLNNATYTRFFYRPGTAQPDAVLVMIPGFLGGALGFKVVAENLVTKALEAGFLLEVWAFDRRGHQLEDREGLDIAEENVNPQIALDWLFGEELDMTLAPELDRRAVFHGPQADAAFIANWTPLVFSHDIDAVVEEARSRAVNQNVFLGGHSAGTGFTARYAATDFDLSGDGPAQPGFEKLRGLILLEGGGGSTGGDEPDEDELDRIEDRADGGLFFAVRDDVPPTNPEVPVPGRCTDGTACFVDSEEDDCEGIGNETCTESQTAYSILSFLGFPFLTPELLAAAEAAAVQAIDDLTENQIILLQDQGGIEGNNAIAVVDSIGAFRALAPGTVANFAGEFLDDEGSVSGLFGGNSFLTGSLGGPGPVVDGVGTWQQITQTPLPEGLFQDLGPAPTELPGSTWGTAAEVVRVDRFIGSFFVGQSNFVDWYFPGSGLSTTSGLPSLDSTALSVGRDRRDIENLTQAANIDIPVLAIGGSNGLTPVPADFIPFAESIGTCAAPSCDGTPRVVDDETPSEAFPTFGGIDGGFEAVIIEGIAHVDVLGPEDLGVTAEYYETLVNFLLRNAE